MSCDLLETEQPGPHYKGDVREPKDVLMMTPEPCEHCKTLAEQLKAALAQIEALTIDNYFTSGKHHGQQ